MATTTARRRKAHTITKAWDIAKELDYGQKMQLVSMLIESFKPIQTNPVFDMPLDEEFADMDKELYTAEEAYEMTMKDIKAIYDEKDAV